MRNSIVIFMLLLQSLSLSCSMAHAETSSPVPVSKRIQTLIADLGARRFGARQRAESELRYLGPQAIDQLLEAQYHQSREISLAARQIVNTLTVNWSRADEHPIIAQVLQDYDDLSASRRTAKADWLAKLEDGIGFPAVVRIARYEQSDSVAKEAALSLMENFDPQDEDQQRSLLAASANLTTENRVTLRWIRAFSSDIRAEIELVDDPVATKERLRAWNEFARQEEKLNGSSRTTLDISGKLNRRVAELALRYLKREDANDVEAQAMVSKAIDLFARSAEDDPSSVIRLSAWLIDAKQNDLFKEKIWERFKELRIDHPQFVYLAAEAFASDDADKSQQLAEEAFNLHSEFSEEADPKFLDPLMLVFSRINTAIALENRGLTEWAIREYRRLMEFESDLWRIGLVKEQATVILSELLHDRGLDEEAADALATLGEQESVRLFGDVDDRDAEGIQARMHYFRSEHFRKEADRQQQIEHLQKAIAADPTDADVLIAMHRLPRTDEKWQQQTSQRIRSAVRNFEAKIARKRKGGEIANRADVAKYLNQIAWLVGNTEGDNQEAIEYSRRSLELRPHSPGSLDTLARTYFAVGDLDKAIKYQRRAAKLEPHSRQIANQLTEFEAVRSQGFNAKLKAEP